MERKIIKPLFKLCLFILLGIMVFVAIDYVTYSKTEKYNLEEIENGKYVIYQRTVSAIPAQNYEIATMSINGSLVTVKGSVKFVFSRENEDYAIIEKTHLVNGDKATIYISKDKVEYGTTITIAR